MNILFFTNTYLPHVGGVARSIETAVQGLREAGHRVYIVAPEYKQATPFDPDCLRVPAVTDVGGFSLPLTLLPLLWLVETWLFEKPGGIHVRRSRQRKKGAPDHSGAPCSHEDR